MKKFEKVVIKISGKRDQLGRINKQVGKQAKTAGIIKVHDLDLNPQTTSMISKVLPQIEKIASYNFPKQIKSALIANIVDQVTQASEDHLSSRQSMSGHFTPNFLSTPKYRTPASRVQKESDKEKDSLIKKLSHLHNSNKEILDLEGEPLPNSNIEEVAKWMRSSNPLNRRGPVGVRAVVDNLAKKDEALGENFSNIRNPHFHEKLMSVKRRLEEKEKAETKRKKRQEGGRLWESLGIRY